MSDMGINGAYNPGYNPADLAAWQQMAAAQASMNPAYSPTLGEMPPDSFARTNPTQQQRSFSVLNAAANFVKGAVVDTLSGLFSVSGIATMALAAGAIALTGGAAAIPIAALGIGFGGFQFAKGTVNALSLASQGDAEGAENAFRDIGAGATTALLSVIGARSAYRSGAVKTGTEANGVVTSAQEATSVSKGIPGSIKGTFKQMYTDLTGQSGMMQDGKLVTVLKNGKKEPLSIYRFSKDEALQRFESFTFRVRNKFSDPNEVLKKETQQLAETSEQMKDGRLSSEDKAILKARKDQLQQAVKRQKSYLSEYNRRQAAINKVQELDNQIAAKQEQLGNLDADKANTANKAKLQAEIKAMEKSRSQASVEALSKLEAQEARYKQNIEALAQEEAQKTAQKPGKQAESKKSGISEVAKSQEKLLVDFAELSPEQFAQLEAKTQADVLNFKAKQLEAKGNTITVDDIAEVAALRARAQGIETFSGRLKRQFNEQNDKGNVPLFLARANQQSDNTQPGYSNYQ